MTPTNQFYNYGPLTCASLSTENANHTVSSAMRLSVIYRP